MNNAPWIEKYRPSDFNDIVLDSTNKKILLNIVKKQYFPNLLFYGPPGTGKTTTIINLIDMYHKEYNLKKKGSTIHLNASDDRGIDIIRNQISQFVNTKTLFGDGMKFVILDEVDYMTKNAQQALRYLIQQYSDNIRFCLICNYISRIDEALQNEFVRLRFNQLPEKDIISFLENINIAEKLNYSQEALLSIQQLFNSDIRSMINYMQSNDKLISNKKIIKRELWEKLIETINNNNTSVNIEIINNISIEFNIEKKNILKIFFNFIIRSKREYVNMELLNFIENILHVSDMNIDYILPYTIIKLNKFFKQN